MLQGTLSDRPGVLAPGTSGTSYSCESMELGQCHEAGELGDPGGSFPVSLSPVGLIQDGMLGLEQLVHALPAFLCPSEIVSGSRGLGEPASWDRILRSPS